jgi:thymidylate kinase
MKRTLIVNFYGGPGSGKSTTAARIFSELKDRGYNVELATEYAKDMTWQKSNHVLDNQLYVFAKQQHRIWRLDGKVDMILTDAPLLNSLVYGETSQIFKKLVVEEYLKRPTFNIFLRRVKKYNPSGRSQTEEEAREIDQITMNVFSNLEENEGFDMVIDGEKESTSQIIEGIMEKYNELWNSQR